MRKKALALLFSLFAISPIAFTADRGDIALAAQMGWNFEFENIVAGTQAHYYIADNIGLGLSNDIQEEFDLLAFNLKWSLEPFELSLDLGWARSDSEDSFLASGQFQYLFALSPGLALFIALKYYFLDSKLESAASGLGLRLLF